MEEYHKAQNPEQAHSLTKKNFTTTYKKDNAFDRVALSQLTSGDKPGMIFDSDVTAVLKLN